MHLECWHSASNRCRAGEMQETMSTDKKGTRILARTFFAQLRAGGYTPNQILDIATELIDLVTNDLKEVKPSEGASPETRLSA